MDSEQIVDLCNEMFRACMAYKEVINQIGIRLGIRKADQAFQRRISRELYWVHDVSSEQIGLICHVLPETVLEWVRWGEIFEPCLGCYGPVAVIREYRESPHVENYGAIVCRECYERRSENRRAEYLADAENDRIKRIAALRGMPYDEYLQTDHWKTIRVEALERDGHRCRLCNSTSRLNVHHRTYERLGEELPDDLTTLCQPCHESFHENQKAAPDLRTHEPSTNGA